MHTSPKINSTVVTLADGSTDVWSIVEPKTEGTRLEELERRVDILTRQMGRMMADRVGE